MNVTPRKGWRTLRSTVARTIRPATQTIRRTAAIVTASHSRAIHPIAQFLPGVAVESIWPGAARSRSRSSLCVAWFASAVRQSLQSLLGGAQGLAKPRDLCFDSRLLRAVKVRIVRAAGISRRALRTRSILPPCRTGDDRKKQ